MWQVDFSVAEKLKSNSIVYNWMSNSHRPRILRQVPRIPFDFRVLENLPFEDPEKVMGINGAKSKRCCFAHS
jgi:hypothetical protein